MIRAALTKIASAYLQKVNKASDFGVAFRSGDPLPSGSSFAGGIYGADSALKVSALSACVRLISGTVAKLPAHVFRLNGDDRKRERRHPLDQILNVRPNAWQTPFEFRRMMTAHVAMHGNGIAKKIKSPTGQIEALVPFQAGTVSVIQEDPDAPPIYTVSTRGSVRRYPASEIFHLRDLTLDGVVGLSRIKQAQQGIALSMAAETYGTSYFMNGSEPGTVLETDKNLTDAQRKQLIDSFRARHGGAGNAHAPMIAEGGLKVKPLSSSNKDSQFLELRSFQVEDIARLYGVPAHLIGLSEKQTSWGTGVEQMSLGFLVFHLLDWLVMWETALKRDCLDEATESSMFVEHLVEGLLRADLKTRMDAYAVAITNGILSRNEVRKLENREAYDGGDKYLYPSNMMVNGQPQPTQRPSQFPSDRPARAWMPKLFKAARAIKEAS